MEVWHRLYGKRRRGRKSDVNIGDIVRISKVKTIFEKGYLPSWTEEEFIVSDINKKYYPTSYKLSDSEGNEIEGSFYREEIQPILREDNSYLVERIVRRQRRNGNLQYLVKWLGYPSTANSWIDASDLYRID